DIREVYIGRDMAESPFAGQTELSDVAFGNNVTSIPSYAFEGCGKLSRLNLPESLSGIGAYAFAECTSLTEVTIPGNVNSIGNGAFQQCSLLTKVAISNGSGMLATGNETFQHSPLQRVYMGRDMTGYPFSGHAALTELTIGEGVTSIADNAFSGCTGLSALNLPPSVAKIGANAFAGCTGLSSPLTIPSSITHIGASAFSGCTTVESVVIEGSDNPLTMGNNVFLGNPISTVSINRDIAGAPFKGSGIQRLTLGDKITAIYESAFQGCVSLSELTLPSSLKSIGNYAFNGCTSLTEISIPSSVTSLGTQAFGGTQIATARLEDGTEPLSCGNLTFKDCPLTTLYIGRNMTGSPFAGHTGLTDLTFGENL
ncbi:MAG: leucine-rich repeat domain-containing protein, partial [Muribaculaceae bacterium]|nr:leucine-rich repeat domain-containing protein [Muribaculaceae bacterium]